MKNVKKDNSVKEIKTELNEIKKFTESSIVMVPMTWTATCQTVLTLICC